MASIYRRKRSYPIPAGTEIIERRRKATAAELRQNLSQKTIVERFATWTDGKGRKRKERLNEAGDRISVESGNYLISYFDAAGKRQEINSGTTDHDAAEQIAANLKTEVALRKRGIISAEQERIAEAGRRSLAEHVTDFENAMLSPGRTKRHVAYTLKYIREIARASEWVMLADITADDVNRFARDLTKKGRSARTVEGKLTAVKSFTKWLTERGKLASDPLSSVKRPNPKADRRYERRMLLPEEWDWLRLVTINGPGRLGMTGGERMLLYAVAIQTGLRSGELRSLTRGKLFLDATPPYVTCKAGSTKNRKTARQYIQPDLAAELKAHVATKAPRAPVFTMPHGSLVAGMLRQDLADARREWLKSTKDPEERIRREQSDFLQAVNHEGEKADFHSLRHTTGAWLAKNGEHPKVVQTVMRHASITLTMDTYGHLFPGQEADAVANMPSILGGNTAAPEVLQATGTDGMDGTGHDASKLPAYRQQSSGENLRENGESWRILEATRESDPGGNSLQTVTLSDNRRALATNGDSEPGGAQNQERAIRCQRIASMAAVSSVRAHSGCVASNCRTGPCRE